MLLLLLSSAWADPFDTLSADPLGVVLSDSDTPGGFRIVALSHTAEACVGRFREGTWPRDRAVACLDAVTAAATDPRLSPYGAPVARVGDLGNAGLFLSHLAIALGARDQLDPGACDAALHERIAAHLEALALAGFAGVGPSYPSARERWPADQAATLYGLWLGDGAHGTHHADAPLQRYLAGIPATGLPPSELTGVARDAALPRGSSLAFTVRYLAPVAPAIAADLWMRAREAGFLRPMGPFLALREWPPGVERSADIDSGPIIAGIGASATAFGLAAARAVGDDAAASALARTAGLGRSLVGRVPGVTASAADSALAVAIAAQADIRRAPEP